MSTDGDNLPGLVVLSIDGGGIRGLSSLLILREIMTRLQHERGLDRMPEVHEHFDFVGGTGTGGISAAMLGRLKMPLHSAIEHFAKLARDVFADKKMFSTTGSGAFKSTRMQQALKAIVRDATGNEDTKMLDDQTDVRSCKTAVYAMSRHNMNAGLPRVFRSYQAATNQMPDCAIWEALSATTAHPDLFKSIDISDGGVTESFVDGGYGCSNPLARILSEVKLVFPNRHVGCIISLGAGHARTIHIPRFSLLQRLLPTNVIQTAKAIATDSERVAQEMAARFNSVTDVYFRFNVDQGIQSVELGDWERMSEVTAHTRAYMQLPEVSGKIGKSVLEVGNKRRTVSVAYIDGQARVTARKLTMYNGIKTCPQPTSIFVGREELVTRAANYLRDDAATRKVFVVYGLGGAGKTQLALRIIETTFEHWSDIIYADATSTETIETTLKDFATTKGVGDSYEDTLRWLVADTRCWLLVLDNADDPALSITTYLPKSRRGRILVTTRNPQLADLASESSGYCRLSSMEPSEGMQLLLKSSRRENETMEKEDIQAANELLESFGYLPLAIVQAAGYVSAKQCSFVQYQGLYLHQPAKMLQYAVFRMKLDSYERTVFDTWILSYTLLSLLAQQLLGVMAYMQRDCVTMEIFRRATTYIEGFSPVMALAPTDLETYDAVKGLLRSFRDSKNNWDAEQFLAAIEEIMSYSLIEYDRVHSTYIIHPLVHAWARAIQPPVGCVPQHAAYIVAASLNWGRGDTDHEFCRSLELHAAAVSGHYQLIHADVLDCISDISDAKGRWSQSLQLQKLVATARDQQLGREHPDTLRAMGNLANTYSYQGRMKEAEELQVQVLDAMKRVLGEEHPHTLTAMNNLANTYFDQGRVKEAEELRVQVLEASKRVLGEEHPDTLMAMGNLANTYFDQGRMKEAEGLQVQVLDAMKRVLGKEHPDTLMAMGNLANTYFDQGRVKEAEELRVQVLDARKRVLGEEHPHTLMAMSNLAATYSDKGRMKEAEELQVLVLDARKQALRQGHPETLRSMRSLASTYKALGWRYRSIRKSLEREITQIEKVSDRTS